MLFNISLHFYPCTFSLCVRDPSAHLPFFFLYTRPFPSSPSLSFSLPLPPFSLTDAVFYNENNTHALGAKGK